MDSAESSRRDSVSSDSNKKSSTPSYSVFDRDTDDYLL